MCEYCNGDKDVDSSSDIGEETDNLIWCSVAPYEKYMLVSAGVVGILYFNIKFCPMCGRDLQKD